MSEIGIGSLVCIRKIHPDIQFQPLHSSPTYRMDTLDCGELNLGEIGVVLEINIDPHRMVNVKYRIMAPNGSSGWISADYIKPIEEHW